MKARVFVSCGQAKGTDEEYFATYARDHLIELGFDPYVAIHEQTLSGLKENIFKQLENSDYIIFVDFKREELADSKRQHRGSLYSHQELAIASYLEIPVLAFQQRSVKEQDGMAGALQLNPIKFDSPAQLMSGIFAQVLKNAGWSPTDRQLLSATIDAPMPLMVTTDQQGIPTIEDGKPTPMRTIFHLAIKNHSQRKIALQCTGYLKRCIYENYEGKIAELDFRQAELKWAGALGTVSNVNIFPGQTRHLDGIVISHDIPNLGMFNVLTDSSLYRPICAGPGSFILCFSVVSMNFPEAQCCCRLTLGDKIEHLICEEIDCQEIGDYLDKFKITMYRRA
jgi:hypothetical protein